MPSTIQTEQRIILPKGRFLVQKPHPIRYPAIQMFKNEDEFRCFRLYCEEVAPQLSFSNQSVWHRLLLQAGQDQSFIQHGIITIGALRKSLKMMGTNTIRLPGTHKLPPYLMESEHERGRAHAACHEFALRQVIFGAQNPHSC